MDNWCSFNYIDLKHWCFHAWYCWKSIVSISVELCWHPLFVWTHLTIQPWNNKWYKLFIIFGLIFASNVNSDTAVWNLQLCTSSFMLKEHHTHCLHVWYTIWWVAVKFRLYWNYGCYIRDVVYPSSLSLSFVIIDLNMKSYHHSCSYCFIINHYCIMLSSTNIFYLLPVATGDSPNANPENNVPFQIFPSLCLPGTSKNGRLTMHWHK